MPCAELVLFATEAIHSPIWRRCQLDRMPLSAASSILKGTIATSGAITWSSHEAMKNKSVTHVSVAVSLIAFISVFFIHSRLTTLQGAPLALNETQCSALGTSVDFSVELCTLLNHQLQGYVKIVRQNYTECRAALSVNFTKDKEFDFLGRQLIGPDSFFLR